MKPLNWNPTEQQIEDAKDTLAWAHREMMNAITPELGMAQLGLPVGGAEAKVAYNIALFKEGGFNAGDTLGQTMISMAWKRHRDRQEGA